MSPLLLKCIKIHIFWAIYIWLGLESCKNPDSTTISAKASSKTQTIESSQVQLSDTLWVKKIPLNHSFLKSTCFLNGDSMLQCTTKQAWINAGNNKVAAYCRVDVGHGDSLVLFNYYAFTDKRGLAEAGNLLTNEQAKEIVNVLKNQPVDINQFFKTDYCIERNYLGNFYNLGFISYWLKEDAVTKPLALTLDTRGKGHRIAEAHPGNGFFILSIKG